MHWRLVEKLARFVSLGRARIDLILNLAFQQIRKNRARMPVRRGGSARSDGERDHGYLRIGHFSQGFLHQCLHFDG